ncbi:MAG: hypothetical protein IJA07_10700 [Agathobacter sp.]|nr:hypothetical protein [Agathobacter sp.]
MEASYGDESTDEELLEEPLSIRNHVISLCEQMIDISRELDDVRHEYDRVTAYLNDIQIVEGLAGEQRKQLEDVATQLSKLTNARNNYLNAEHKISDDTFKQMEEMEAEIPAIIRRLKVNEADLETVRHDLNYLASQKVEWSVIKQEREEELEQLRKLSVVLLFGIGGIAILVALLSITLKWEFLPLFIVALVATLSASYVILRIQECNKDIKQSEVNQNYIISLENRIKIKYVNAKNAVDYTCKRYHVVNAKELTYHYEQYIEICKEREKFKQTNEDLEYMKNRLVRILRSMNLYDARIWLNYTDAIVNKNEMVELKHELFERRKFLRGRIDYNLNAISEMRNDVDLYVDRMGEKSVQVRAIINKVDELNKGLGLL